MATVHLDDQIFYDPFEAASSKPLSRSLHNGRGTYTSVSSALLTRPQEAGGLRQNKVIDNGQSCRPVEPSSAASADKGINITVNNNGNNDAKAGTGRSNPADEFTSTQQQPKSFSVLPKALQATLDQPGLVGSVAREPGQALVPDNSVWNTATLKTAGCSLDNKTRPHGHGSQHDTRPFTQSGEKSSNRDSETQNRSDNHHHQGSSNQTAEPEHRHPLAPDSREQKNEGSTVQPQAKRSQTSIPTLSDNKSIDLDGLYLAATAAIQHQPQWCAGGESATKPPSNEEQNQEDSEESDKATQYSDRMSHQSSRRNARSDKHCVPSHDGRPGEQDQNIDEQNNVRSPTSKHQKSNRFPSCEAGDVCSPPPKRRKGNPLTKSTVLRPVAREHSHSDTSRSQRVKTSAPDWKRSGRRNVLSSSFSQKSIDPEAMFQEWPLENAFLKRVAVDGMTTFQVQFTWNPCATHGRKDRVTKDPQDVYSVRESPSSTLGRAAGPYHTPEDALIELTDDDVQSLALTEEEEEEEEEVEWQFEKILGIRKRGRGNQVLVKWTHFEKPTWEPMKNFLGTEALRTYMAQHGEIHTMTRGIK